MTLYTQVSSNRFKTVWYVLLFSVLLLALGYVVAWYFNSAAILVIFAVIVIVQGVIGWWYSDSVALLAAGAKPMADSVSPNVATRVERIVQNLSTTAGIAMPRLYSINDTAMNAFATGRDADHAAIAMTTGLIERLDDNELAGVLAHELSHIGNEDIRLMSVVMIMAGLIALISDFFLRSMFWGGNRRRNNNDEGGNSMMIVAIVLAILAPLASFMIQLAISRKREFMADANAVLLTRYPEGMISALRKIGGDEEPLEAANRGSAHMYFANPFKKGAMKDLFSTHPSIESRIEAIQAGSGMHKVA